MIGGKMSTAHKYMGVVILECAYDRRHRYYVQTVAQSDDYQTTYWDEANSPKCNSLSEAREIIRNRVAYERAEAEQMRRLDAQER